MYNFRAIGQVLWSYCILKIGRDMLQKNPFGVYVIVSKYWDVPLVVYLVIDKFWDVASDTSPLYQI